MLSSRDLPRKKALVCPLQIRPSLPLFFPRTFVVGTRRMQPRAGSILLAATILLVALVSCKDSTNPDPLGPPASFVIMSGNQQDDTVGQELPQPLVARITDASGTAVPGAVVSFVVTSGGGSVFSPAVQANAQGIVQNRWTLGTSTAAAQEVEVRSVNPNTGAPIVFGRFQATARPDRPATLTKTDGDGQQGTAGAKLANALRVRVTDQYGNPVPGVTVAWAIAGGGGSVSAPTSTTNTTGHAAAEWTLGPAAGQGSVTATVAGLSAQSFSAFAAAGTPAHVRIAEGNGQRARVATGLSNPLSALVVDANENPVAGVAVAWSVLTGNGTITPRAAATDANGIARADWALGQTAGGQSARASVAGIASVDFTATADPGNPAGIAVVSGNGQSASVGTALPVPLVVRVVDPYGNAVPDVTVTFAGTGGSLSAQAATTSATGEAQAVWTLPTAAGAYTTNASVTGLAAAQFTATATAGAAASWAKTGGDAQNGGVGQPLADSLTVRILDQYGNPVSGVSVTWTPNGGGSVSPPTSVTSATGHASTRRTLSTTPGVHTTLASVSGLSQLTFTAAAGAGPAVTLEKVSGDAQSGGLNQPLANPLVVRLRDQYGNAVPGATLQWTVIGGGGSVSPTSAVSNADGLASTNWTIGGTGANQVRAIHGALNVTFTATVTGLSAATVNPGNFRDRVGVIGQATTLTARVLDANGVPIANATVEWVLTGGSGDLSVSASTTDASGQASTDFTPGIAAGSNFVEARAAGATPGRYLIWTRALAPARVVAVTGDNQNGVVGQPMPTEIRARVEDQHGNGVYGDTVRFSVTGGGYVERPFFVTDSLGFTASTKWIPGAPGAATVTASASGHSTTFDASVVASSSPSLFIENQPLGQLSPLGGTSPSLAPVTVRLVDAAGLPISGATVTWTHFGSPITTTTDSEGRSTASVRYTDDPVVQTATISAAGAVATLYIVLRWSGANVTGFASPPPGFLSARVGTRVESPVVASCQDRQGGPAESCSVFVSGAGGTGFGGTFFPAPGYRPPGQRAFFWILPTTPGTYYFWVTRPGAPNYTDARATP